MLKEHRGAAWRFRGIEISKIGNTEPRYFFCDSLAIYREEFQPLHFAAQPKRNLRPWRGQIAGLNTGTGRLPFPTREETILPRNQEREFKTSVVQSGPQKFELRYAGRDATIVYEYRPAAGKSGRDHGQRERRSSVPAAGRAAASGSRIRHRPAWLQGSLMTAKLDGDVVRATFKYGTRQVEYELRLWQKSLVLDARARGRRGDGACRLDAWLGSRDRN
jgi:hypothetical protein